MNRMSILCLLAGCCTAMAATESSFEMSRNGGGTLTVNGKPLVTFTPGYFSAVWNGGGFGYDFQSKESNVVRSSSTRNGVVLSLEMKVASPAEGQVELSYKMTPDKDIMLNSMHVSLTSASMNFKGRKARMNDQETPAWPVEFKSVHVHSVANVRSLELDTAEGPVEIEFAEPVPVMMQDNRQWGDSMEVRIGPQMAGGEMWPAGKSFETRFTLKCSAGIKLESTEPTVIMEKDGWSPLKEKLDIVPGSAVDFSGFGFADGPAGKYGRVKAVGPHFEFERKPGVAQRFYGVNFCFTAHDLSHEEADRLAERLWRLGYNAVRYHHYEGNLQDYSNGLCTALKADKMERLDYLHHALTKRGIYLTTDTFVSRTVFASCVFPGEKGNLGMNEIKMLLPVNDKMFENWKEFCRNFFGHRNPYTGLTYAQDPAMAWISLINEGNFGNYFGGLPKRTNDEWLKAWQAWAEKRYGDAAARNRAWGVAADFAITKLPDWGGNEVMRRDFQRFQCEVEIDLYRRMTAFLRDELGCQALFTDMNSWTNPLWTQVARNEFDYVDDHFYVDHPQFLGTSWRLPSKCGNASPVRAGAVGGGHTAFTRLLDKPFTITEYNYSAPGRYRGVGGIMLGCLATIQDWSGIWRFAYSHWNGNLFKVSPLGYFDLVTDPLNQCAERASLCLYLRGDMEAASRKVAITVPKDVLDGPFDMGNGLTPPWQRMNLIAQVGYLVGQKNGKAAADVSVGVAAGAPAGAHVVEATPKTSAAAERIKALFKEQGWLPQDNITDEQKSIAQSANGQLTVHGPSNTLTLNTPRTAGGFAMAGQAIETAAVRIMVQDTDATVWVSSLDGKDIKASRRLLVTHLTDCQNAGATFADKNRQILLKWGIVPHMVRNGRATVLIRLPQQTRTTVWRLASNGERLSQLPTAMTAEGLRLELDIKGPHGAQLLYEVVCE